LLSAMFSISSIAVRCSVVSTFCILLESAMKLKSIGFVMSVMDVNDAMVVLLIVLLRIFLRSLSTGGTFA
jgi:hypothetical protein